MKRSMLVLVAAGLVGCATARPILYANPKYNQVGRDGAQRDIADCEQLAKNAGATPDQGRAAQTATATAIGAVTVAAALGLLLGMFLRRR